jgi:uncharacterized protein (TIGR02186 family)
MKRALLAFATLLATLAGPAHAETLITALSTHRIQISSNYTGAQLTVFGQVERDGRSAARGDPYDIVVTVRGPQRMLVVREKERVGPIWINRNQRRFPERSIYLSVSSTRPLEEVVSEEAGQRDRIGLANAQRTQAVAYNRDLVRYRDALIRILERKGLYRDEERGVTFLAPSLFSAPIRVPATAPTGPYEVEVVLYAGGALLARQTTHFEVVKAGMEQSLASAAHDRPLLYGLATVALALLFGWLATVIFRRD